MRRILLAEPEKGGLAATWSDGTTSFWPAIWLRDQCACPQCRHQNGQRLFEIGDLPEHPTIEQIAMQGDGSVRVVWTDEGHVSIYSAAFLYEHNLKAKRTIPIKLWGADLTELPEEDWLAIVRDPAAELAWLEAYHLHGFGLLRNVPVRPGMVAEVGDRLGFVRTTNYGRLFDVISVPDPNNLANTALGLGVHSDNPYRDPTPGVQLLHCLVCDAPGGESILVDGLAAAEYLRAAAPEQFDLLARVPANFHFADKDTDLRARTPLITVDTENRITAVHFNNRSLAGIDGPVELVEPWYAAYRTFAGILKQAEREVVFRLLPGDLLVMQNERALHGRAAFDANLGRRHLQGCYVDKDGLESRMRVLRRQIANAQQALNGFLAEVAATQQAAALCESTRAPMHVVHLSSARALEACRDAKRNGLPFSVETRPLYLHLTAEAIAAGRLLDLPLLDHVVVAAGGYVSLRDRGVVFDRPLGWR